MITVVANHLSGTELAFWQERCYAEIRPNHILHNARAMMQKTAPDVKLGAVVKANGYGHGAKTVLDVLEGEPFFGTAMVASFAEAIELRQNGYKGELLVLGSISPRWVKDAVQQDITITAANWATAKQYARLLRQNEAGKGRLKLQVKIDTGMNRLGFATSTADERLETAAEIRELYHDEALQVTGMYSHLACADHQCAENTTQIERFTDMKARCDQNRLDLQMHFANSAAMINFPETHQNLVRLGISLYGVNPVEGAPVELKPAMSLFARVVQMRHLRAGDFVSYGATFVAKENMNIAVVSAGYADGLPRCLSNCGEVMIHGQRAPIIGTICMDRCMVDISHISDVAIDDQVLVFGEDEYGTLNVAELAQKANTIAYEIFCHIGERVPRLVV